MNQIINCYTVRKHKYVKAGAATVCVITPSPFPFQMKYLQLKGKWGGKHEA